MVSTVVASAPRLQPSATVDALRGATFVVLAVFTFTVPSSAGLFVAGSLGTSSRVIGGVAVLVGGAALLVGGRRHRLLDPHVLMLLFVGWVYASTVWTIAPRLTEISRWSHVQLLVLTLLVWEFARDRDQWRRLLGAYVAGSAVGALGIVLAVVQGTAYGAGRFSAPGFNPGTQAHVMLLALPMAAYLATSSSRRSVRAAALLFLPLGSGAVLLTASRASLLILPVALAAVPLGRRARGATGQRPTPGTGPLVVGAAAMTSAVLWFVPPATLARLGTISSELAEGDLSGRARLWDASVESIADNPLVGVGTGATRRVLLDAVGDLKGAHNAYLAVTTEVGLLGLLLLLLLLVAAGAVALRHEPQERVLAIALLVVVTLGMVPSHSHVEKSTWLALAFVLAPAADHRRLRTHRGRMALPPPRPHQPTPSTDGVQP